jgi:hypothetical protein
MTQACAQSDAETRNLQVERNAASTQWMLKVMFRAAIVGTASIVACRPPSFGTDSPAEINFKRSRWLLAT